MHSRLASTNALSTFRCLIIITGRNEVLAKVIFLHLSVILFTGGCTRQVHPPPGPGRYTPPQQTPPPGPGRYTPPRDQAGTPPGYGQRSAGTHPTGMHSCWHIICVYFIHSAVSTDYNAVRGCFA